MKHYILYFNGKKEYVSKEFIQKISNVLDDSKVIWIDQDFPSMSYSEDKKIRKLLRQFKLEKKVSKSIDKLLK